MADKKRKWKKVFLAKKIISPFRASSDISPAQPTTAAVAATVATIAVKKDSPLKTEGKPIQVQKKWKRVFLAKKFLPPFSPPTKRPAKVENGADSSPEKPNLRMEWKKIFFAKRMLTPPRRKLPKPFTVANLRQQDPNLRKQDEVHKQWKKVLLAKKILSVSQDLIFSKRPKPSYEDKCFQRYLKSIQKYNSRFREEIIKLEAMQPTANDSMRFHRHFTITTLWPPVYSEREITWTLKQLRSTLSSKERRRLDQILAGINK